MFLAKGVHEGLILPKDFSFLVQLCPTASLKKHPKRTPLFSVFFLDNSIRKFFLDQKNWLFSLVICWWYPQKKSALKSKDFFTFCAHPSLGKKDILMTLTELQT